jgi:hypothetical protein
MPGKDGGICVEEGLMDTGGMSPSVEKEVKGE